ncbi:MAG: hypothetical protein CMA05_04565 [Euryarchaeota archaeon]|nr:hypothetical protein [Euryarchaeota archaeon]|tara:strand:- start:527 stop:757 length:231 start_codon:yes stop_codon:yes gene_type:complete
MSIADIDVVEDSLDELADCFADKMKQVFDECPEAFEGRTSQMDWSAACSSASDDLREELNLLIEKFEMKLHDGEYN